MKVIATVLVVWLAASMILPPVCGATTQDESEPASATAPVYRGGPGHTGHYPGGLAGRGPEGVESVLFVTTHPFAPGPGAPEVPAAMVAVNGDDGALLWRRELAGRPTAPTVAEGLVLVGSDEGGVTAYEAATGEPRWVYKTKTGIIGQPVVAEDVVYFGGGSDKTVYAVNLEGGRKAWTKKVKGEGVYSPVRVEGEALYAFSATHHVPPVLYALATDKGKRLWQKDKLEITPVTGPNDFELAGDLLIACVSPGRYRKKSDVTEDGDPTNYVVAFDAASGKERWRAKVGAPACYGPTVSGGIVVCYGKLGQSESPTEPSELHILAFSTEDGAELWRKSLGRSPLRWASTSPVITEDTVIASSATKVTAFDLETGEERWDNAARSAVVTVADGVALLAAGGGQLTAVDARSGRSRWSATLQPFESPPRGPSCPGEISPPSLAD